MRKLLTLAALVTVAGCAEGDDATMPVVDAQPFFASETGELNRARPRPQTWVDGELFRGLVTPATFSPDSDPFDELYAIGPNHPENSGFLNGVPLISESKPGDQDYNGGRWHMNVLKSGVDPAKYENADRVEDLDLSDFESTGNYFECPLLPARGNS
jgi:hypothetical protein